MPKTEKIQCNLKLRRSVVERLRQEAAAEGITMAALVERRLGGEVAESIPDQVAERFAALEARLAALEDSRSAAGSARVAALLPRRVAVREGEGELLVPLDAGGAERLTTAALAARLGIGRSALNNWALRHPVGAARDGWRLAGRERVAAGGPPRTIWERCAIT